MVREFAANGHELKIDEIEISLQHGIGGVESAIDPSSHICTAGDKCEYDQCQHDRILRCRGSVFIPQESRQASHHSSFPLQECLRIKSLANAKGDGES